VLAIFHSCQAPEPMPTPTPLLCISPEFEDFDVVTSALGDVVGGVWCRTVEEARWESERSLPSVVVIDVGAGTAGAELVTELRGKVPGLKVAVLVPKAFAMAALRPFGTVEVLGRPVDRAVVAKKMAGWVTGGPAPAPAPETRARVAPPLRRGATITRRAVEPAAGRTLPTRSHADKGPDKALLGRLEDAVRRAMDSGRQREALPLPEQTSALVGAAGGEVRTHMSMMGVLEVTPFPALLYKIFANRMTGLMYLSRTGAERTLFFEAGEPVYALSNASAESLGAVLLDLGLLGVKQLAAVLEAKAATELLGQRLLREGILTVEELLFALDHQVHQRFLGCFGFDSGMFVFSAESSWMADLPRFPQNPIALIHGGVQKLVAPNVLATHLQGRLQSYVVRTEKFVHFRPFFPDETGLLDRIDGLQTVDALTRTAGRDVMGMLRLLWALHQADMVDFAPGPQREGVRPARKIPLPSRAALPAVPAQRRASPAAEVAAAVGELYARMGADYWTFLDVPRDADDAALREAFRVALDRVAPEQLRELSPQARSQARVVLQALKKAYNTLVDPAARAQYAARLEDRRPAPATRRRPQLEPSEDEGLLTSQAMSVLERGPALGGEGGQPKLTEDAVEETGRDYARVLYRKAEEAARQGQWRSAWAFVSEATALDENDPQLMALQGWIIFNLPMKDHERQTRVARQRLELSATLSPHLSEPHYYLGRIAEAEGATATAVERYLRAVEVGGDAADAAARLRRLGHGAAAAKPEANLVDRLKGWMTR